MSVICENAFCFSAGCMLTGVQAQAFALLTPTTCDHKWQEITASILQNTLLLHSKPTKKKKKKI